MGFCRIFFCFELIFDSSTIVISKSNTADNTSLFFFVKWNRLRSITRSVPKFYSSRFLSRRWFTQNQCPKITETALIRHLFFKPINFYSKISFKQKNLKKRKKSPPKIDTAEKISEKDKKKFLLCLLTIDAT